MIERNQFADFFQELTGFEPFGWQIELAERVLTEGWPKWLALPTGAGKTMVLPVAIFEAAYRAQRCERVPRRFFYVVDRRIVVDSSYDLAERIARKLQEALERQDVVGEVARVLRDMAQSDRPLDVVRLRGGGFMERDWVTSPLQPVIVTSTVDQFGSRLLFRGYGYGRSWLNALPVQAALCCCDSMVFLDEAHQSEAFRQTLEAVEQLRMQGQEAKQIVGPFRVVLLSATPRVGGDQVWVPAGLQDDERLRPRLTAEKLVRFHKLSDERFEEGIAEKTRALIEEAPDARIIGVIVNRVHRARKVFRLLRGQGNGRWEVLLLTGRIRPLDRDRLLQQWLDYLKADPERPVSDRPLIVVATQTIEVGADLDFDVMVTEVAALDALLQRLGRLNRLGRRKRALCYVVASEEQLKKKHEDFVYGSALASTARLLKEVCGRSGCNLNWESAHELREGLEGPLEGFLSPAPDAPLLSAAYLDLLVQTSPLPEPDIDVAPFLHGLRRTIPEVQVVWRADLSEEGPKTWPEIVSALPPKSTEAIALPIWSVRSWLKEAKVGDFADTEGVAAEASDSSGSSRLCLRWTDEGGEVVEADQIRPGDILVVPTSYGGCDEFGWDPEAKSEPVDLAEEAAYEEEQVLRLHPALLRQWLEDEVVQQHALVLLQGLREWLEAQDHEQAEQLGMELLTLLAEHARWPWIRELSDQKLSEQQHWKWTLYARRGVLLLGRGLSEHRLSEATGRQVSLEAHQEAVAWLARTYAEALQLPCVNAFERSGQNHDVGKGYPRFQAMLYGDWTPVNAGAPLLAKSGMDSRDWRALRQSRELAGLPPGWRHEMLSAFMLERLAKVEDDLILHLVAAHHGGARPYLPPVLDMQPLEFTMQVNGQQVRCNGEIAPDWLAQTVPKRFWQMVDRFGWWGCAYLEAILRMADWMVSKSEAQP
ncbi:type I-G CRISPR-associated helicase/endonuclease Cas3g [Rhodothermus marinus]|jgi:CRISPR-associated endonuclease/helicase Cas3|uniref:CRISPR-associated helicase Cas3, Anaes-subtype n=1 Tax=Rhodothermus marinus (strain ATCC 43812 / DSM 4252 / R-10) TaxID=518766 RepID=D0MKL2_RHOM4|nr:type I-U CRISPR-associated helicase/endonuclease Cas3 [Rhodothermus marinus]ACY49676.1 CRISPR-associated helicase Cas3, Anaes-subtype [Rhodothermus marinus DSM 4252]